MNILKKMTSLLLVAGIAGLAAFSTLSLQAEAASARKIDARVQQTLSDFRADVKGGSQVLSKAKGLLVFPRTYQGGFVFGGEYGQGALLVGGRTIDYYSIVSVSYGFQIGGQRKALIIAFMTDQALKDFRDTQGWEIGPDATVAIANIGADGELDLTALNQPIVAFAVDQRGLMAGISLEGTKITRLDK